LSELFGSLLPDEPSAVPAAAYRVLAIKYRPSQFEDLIGQEAMVRTLTHAIEANRLPNAWMLTGVRGIGKTTTARIIARALNCTGVDGKGGPTIHPCGVCDACKAITEDRHVDIQEMDAASRTSVDDIREIIDGVRYGPVSARYKIYILDEVHMLSKNAFNALLKTLEEPPPHTKFIFATTEIRKVPVTILSRCQRFDLRRINAAELATLYAKIAVKENVEAEPEAIKLIARAADGSARDGLSLLDQAISRGNEKVLEADVKDMLGLADRGRVISLCSDVLHGKLREALASFEDLGALGADPLQTLQDMADMIHFLTRVQIVPELATSSETPELEKKMAGELADIKLPALVRGWQILLKGITEVQTASRPAEAAEMVLIRLAYASDMPSPDELLRQLREKTSSEASSTSGGSGPSGGARAQRSGSNIVSLATPHQIAAAPLVMPDEGVAVACLPMTFREIVALFEEKREAGLYAFLYDEVHFVRTSPGLLELRLRAGAPMGPVNKIAQCLIQWTNRQWMVSVVEEAGQPTLGEEERRKEEERHTRAEAHPLFAATRKTFPDARLVALRQKTLSVAPASDAKSEAAWDTFEDATPTESEEQ